MNRNTCYGIDIQKKIQQIHGTLFVKGWQAPVEAPDMPKIIALVGPQL